MLCWISDSKRKHELMIRRCKRSIMLHRFYFWLWY